MSFGASSTEGEGVKHPPSGTFTAVATGNEHACGLRANGTVTCWRAFANDDECAHWVFRTTGMECFGISGGIDVKPPAGLFGPS